VYVTALNTDMHLVTLGSDVQAFSHSSVQVIEAPHIEQEKLGTLKEDAKMYSSNRPLNFG
jgi:hypothetical protein